jgi:hypothetical protein
VLGSAGGGAGDGVAGGPAGITTGSGMGPVGRLGVIVLRSSERMTRSVIEISNCCSDKVDGNLPRHSQRCRNGARVASLRVAVRRGDPAIVQQLMRAGADPDAGGSRGTTLRDAIHPCWIAGPLQRSPP